MKTIKNKYANSNLTNIRNQKVVKSNELIQQRTHMLSVQEQKIILFLISQLKPEQKEFEWQTFAISEFCEVCGIDNRSGKNYEDLRNSIKNLSDKSLWVIGDDKDTLIRWIGSAEIEKGNGKVKIRFDENMKPYLLELKQRYTQFDLIYTLPMKSKYSVRMYEILKSYEKLNEPVKFSLDRFQNLMGSEYTRWADMRRRIIEVALPEINEYTDINVEYFIVKSGKAVSHVVFEVNSKKTFSETVATYQKIAKKLNKSDI